MTIEIIDLEAHKANCYRCNKFALCAQARRIVELAGQALLDVAAINGPRKRGKA